VRFLVLFTLAAAMFADPIPVEVRRGPKDGTMRISIPFASIPLQKQGKEWVSSLEIVYKLQGPDGRTFDSVPEVVQIKIEDKLRKKYEQQSLTLTRPLLEDSSVHQLRIEVTAKPSGATGFSTLLLGSTFVADANVALVPFLAFTPAKDTRQLRAEDISLLEDGVERTASLYQLERLAPQTIPVDVTLLFDCSSGMSASAADLDVVSIRKGLLEEFPELRIAIHGFSDRLAILTPHTRDEAVLDKAGSMLNSVPAGPRHVFANVGEALRRFDFRQPAVRMLVVFSNGETVRSTDTLTYQRVVATARETGVAIYPVYTGPATGLAGPGPESIQRPTRDGMAEMIRLNRIMGEKFASSEFMRLSETGGQQFSKIRGADILPTILRHISKTAKTAYVAGYQPAAGDAERERQVKVVLRDKDRGRIVGGNRTVVR